jgi:hypothetical protein
LGDDTLDYLGNLLPYYKLDIDIKDAVSSNFDIDTLYRGLGGAPLGMWKYAHKDLEKVYSSLG